MRKRATQNSTSVSLFPFIAVLLCTMGALLIVLVSVTRLSRERAEMRSADSQTAAAEQGADDANQQRAQQIEHVRQHANQLRKLRENAQSQLRDDQLRLSHLEQRMRQLQDEAAKLQIAAEELEHLDEQRFSDRRQAEEELKRLRDLLEESRSTVASLKEEAESRKHSYAIIPYEGPNGTCRRPIYIECLRDEVIIQPEGIKLTEQDFLPPLGPGNPLAAALRAAREHIVGASATNTPDKSAEPYPLILVRPNGIEAYYAVRRAIASWDSDFGYEFVDGEWELLYPPPDPQLATAEFRAVELSRARLRVLAAAAPRAYRAQRAFGGLGEGHGGDGSVGSGFGNAIGGDSQQVATSTSQDPPAGGQSQMATQTSGAPGPSDTSTAESGQMTVEGNGRSSAANSGYGKAAAGGDAGQASQGSVAGRRSGGSGGAQGGGGGNTAVPSDLAGGANQQDATGNAASGEPAGMDATTSAQDRPKGAAGAAAMSGGGSSAGSPATTAGSSTASGGAAAQGTMGSDPPEASGNQML
jgi:hypothetical protein